MSVTCNRTPITYIWLLNIIFLFPQKVVVEVRVVFLKIGEIDTLKEFYQADAFLQAKWHEPRLDGKLPEVRS